MPLGQPPTKGLGLGSAHLYPVGDAFLPEIPSEPKHGILGRAATARAHRTGAQGMTGGREGSGDHFDGRRYVNPTRPRFDYMLANPEVRRLAAWRTVERARPTLADRESYRARVAAVAAAHALAR